MKIDSAVTLKHADTTLNLTNKDYEGSQMVPAGSGLEELYMNEEEMMWFTVQKDATNGGMSYQEIMVFSKIISTFEDKKYQS